MDLKVELAGTVAGLLLLGAFFLAPVVPYSQSFQIPGSGRLTGPPCSPSSASVTITEAQGGGASNSSVVVLCQAPTPPAVVNGHSTLSYRLLGAGAPPFPSEVEVTQGNRSALVYFEGSRAVAAEVIGPAGTEFDPPGVGVVRSSFRSVGLGEQNYTVVIQNAGAEEISPALVGLRLPGDSNSGNYTVDGLVWMGRDPLADCGSGSPPVLLPGAECRVSVLRSLPANVSLTYHVEVEGLMGGKPFFLSQAFSAYLPSAAVDPAWVGEFIARVNAARGTSLVENSALDSFAALRFATASAQPGISDYGFANDVKAFFLSGGQSVTEELLFPTGLPPSNYTSFLQAYAPGHWAALTNGTFAQFGYHIGEAPYYVISASCPVTEVPAGGVNITAYFQAHGCAVTPQADMTWLVIVLTP